MSLGFKPPILTKSQILNAARFTLSVLARHNIQACIFGSVAGMLHGMEIRTPKDIDLIVLNAADDQDDQTLKDLLVASEPDRFFLVGSLAPGASHQVLWLNVDGPAPATARSTVSVSQLASKAITSTGIKPGKVSDGTVPRPVCKIDILLPHHLSLPPLPVSRLEQSTVLTFPTPSEDDATFESDTQHPALYMPLFPSLLLKLRAWSDHSAPDARGIMRQRIPQDEDDIEELLGLNVSAADVRKYDLTREKWALGGFENTKDVEKCIRRYVAKWPQTIKMWQAVGFM